MTSDPAEAMYFDGEPVRHIVTFRERQRLQRREQLDRAAIRAMLGIRMRGRVIAFA